MTYRMASPEDQLHGGADPKIVQGFIELLRNGTPPESTPQGARYAVAAGVRGAESIRSGGMMLDIPALPDDLENYDFAALQ